MFYPPPRGKITDNRCVDFWYNDNFIQAICHVQFSSFLTYFFISSSRIEADSSNILKTNSVTQVGLKVVFHSGQTWTR